MYRAGASSGTIVLALALALFVGTAVNIALTWLALRPIRNIETTIRRIGRGDNAARVEASPVADTALADIGDTVNALLDSLDRDRVEMREMATAVIRAGDRERDRIGTELHESIAQSVAALTLQISAMLNEPLDARTVAHLGELRVLTRQILDQVDVLCHSIHPRVLNDLGLVAGLRRLARDVSTSRIAVDVNVADECEERFRDLGVAISSALYRIAQEAVQNAIGHAKANRIHVDLACDTAGLSMAITDDGRGFDVETATRRRPGTGLFTMRQRASLVGGSLRIICAPGQGTRVGVTIPAAATTLSR
jgi:signal transduction histidine kinase